MRALTLTQPWAGLIASGVKTIENRSWKPPRALVGQRFALHASREVDAKVMEYLIGEGYAVSAAQAPIIWTTTSALVATVELDDWIESIDDCPAGQSAFWMGPVAFVLRDIVRLPKPVPCKGARGFWDIPAIELAATLAQEQIARRAA